MLFPSLSAIKPEGERQTCTRPTMSWLCETQHTHKWSVWFQQSSVENKIILSGCSQVNPLQVKFRDSSSSSVYTLLLLLWGNYTRLKVDVRPLSWFLFFLFSSNAHALSAISSFLSCQVLEVDNSLQISFILRAGLFTKANQHVTCKTQIRRTGFFSVTLWEIIWKFEGEIKMTEWNNSNEMCLVNRGYCS